MALLGCSSPLEPRSRKPRDPGHPCSRTGRSLALRSVRQGRATGDSRGNCLITDRLIIHRVIDARRRNSEQEESEGLLPSCLTLFGDPYHLTYGIAAPIAGPANVSTP